MQQPSEEIKAKLDIVDVIREYIPLKPAGMNFRAPCPFHREKTPSFVVSPDKQIWHCFGCSKGGDVFSFIMDIEGLNFVEALRVLAQKAGITLKKQNPKLASQRNRLLDIMDIAVNYYHEILINTNINSNLGQELEIIKKYLVERGVKQETILQWKIGYSPNSWDDIIKLLLNSGFSENEIFLAGLSVKKQDSNRFYNRFRNRIMFPIFDINGSSVAFSARVSPDKEETEKLGKYINSPQTIIYNKSNILFGLDKAKLSIKQEKKVVITEGQMDVITAHQHGFKNVIASSGTALTIEQVKLIKRYTDNVVLAFDSDQAGEMASDRGAKIGMQAGMNIKIVKIPDGKDPDDYIKKNPEQWLKIIENAKEIMEHYFDLILTNVDLELIENKRLVSQKLLPIIARLENKIEKNFWLKKLSEKINIDENILNETLQNSKVPKNNFAANQTNEVPPVKEVSNIQDLNRAERLSELLLIIIIKFPDLIKYAVNNINPEQVIGNANKIIYKKLIIEYNNKEREFNYQNFKNMLSEDDSLDFFNKLTILGDRDFYNFDLEKAKSELSKISNSLKKNYLIMRMKEIEMLIVKGEKETNINTDELMNELRILSEKLNNVS